MKLNVRYVLKIPRVKDLSKIDSGNGGKARDRRDMAGRADGICLASVASKELCLFPNINAPAGTSH